MKDTLNYLFGNNTLGKEEAREALKKISTGNYNTSQVAAFLTVFRMRSITVEELEGFRDAMLDLCLRIDLSEYNLLDLCGTGGDNKDTFNISTLTAFVVAGTGIKVSKHGNYGVSSVCGSSNVMEHLGVRFTNDTDILRKNIEEAGICFLHAPLFHPAMKQVAPIRKELGTKTFFNMLGPMVNPSFPKNQLVGVFSLELARLYSYLYQKSERNYTILHSLDVYDEISLTAPFKMISRKAEKIMEPNDLGFKTIKPEELAGGATVEASAKLFMQVLQGKGTQAQNNVVTANAMMGIQCCMPELSLADCKSMAEESLLSGKALTVLNKIISN
jgi:anthranilate phosphoribosyltransferase